MNKRYRNQDIGTKDRIAVVGVSSGLGVTHMSLAMANYLQAVLKIDVLYIEVSEKSKLYNMVKEKPVYIGNSVGYLYKGVVYVVSATVKEALSLARVFEGVIIYDIDILDDNTSEIMLISNKSICIGSVSTWKINEYADFIANVLNKQITNNDNHVGFKALNYDKGKKKMFFAMTGCKVKKIPFINDPFSLREEDFDSILDFMG
ncbi:MAG: hypothetical protein HUJ71_07370 [Pseudobutyrivibrio sp.]|nr:hypothetical protein [Pseudobutyrivibrio sp.]